MPNMANITVKKADGTTDVVYTALTPSAGDKVSARWRANAASTIPTHRPVVDLVSRNNGNQDGRRVVFSGKFPVVETLNGIPTVTAIVPIEMSMLIPQNVDSAQVSEAVAQLTNLTVSSLIRTSFIDGYAPT